MKKQLLALLLLASLPAHAIVNLDEIHSRDVELGLSGALGINFSGSKGNSDETNTQLSAQLQRGTETYSDILMVSYHYGEANGQLNNDNAFIHLRHIQKMDATFSWELFTQLQNDRFSRLSLRTLVGGGLRYKWAETDNRIILGVGAFYERERIDDTSLSVDERREHRNWRGNFYSIISHTLNPQSHLFGTLYFQPRFDDTTDYRLLLQSGIKVKIAKSLDLVIGLDAAYDNKPPLTVEKYDINYRSGLEYTF
ncbi:MAG: DUF481 domain-containing protein [Gammaproteobacteria bacterium]|nr:DUF481 domain-containing protein [Gammaproteobacteria bacterium]MCF6230825.1 DUF481 domain-containing protein [Gammaproteobacteria bacterium]